MLSTWWGVRPVSPDERPFVGPVLDGLAVATGHGSEGVILGAGTASLLAAQLARRVRLRSTRSRSSVRSTSRTLPFSCASRPARSITASARSTGIANNVFPSRPTVVSAANSAFTTASSVASTVAAKSGPKRYGSTERAVHRDGHVHDRVGRPDREPVGRGERQHLLTAPIGRVGTGGCQAHPAALGDAPKLVRKERRVGGHDHHA